jgi:hypothetical protein
MSSMIRFRCPQCKMVLQHHEAHAKVLCPGCGRKTRVPTPTLQSKPYKPPPPPQNPNPTILGEPLDKVPVIVCTCPKCGRQLEHLLHEICRCPNCSNLFVASPHQAPTPPKPDLAAPPAPWNDPTFLDYLDRATPPKPAWPAPVSAFPPELPAPPSPPVYPLWPTVPLQSTPDALKPVPPTLPALEPLHQIDTLPDNPAPSHCIGCGGKMNNTLQCAWCKLSYCCEVCLNRHFKITAHDEKIASAKAEEQADRRRAELAATWPERQRRGWIIAGCIIGGLLLLAVIGKMLDGGHRTGKPDTKYSLRYWNEPRRSNDPTDAYFQAVAASTAATVYCRGEPVINGYSALYVDWDTGTRQSIHADRFFVEKVPEKR